MPLVSKAFGDIITFTRASTGTYFDSAGVLQSAAIDVPRFDYDPVTLAARGLLIEEARTNSIRNNTMQGAVAGTPGTLPTNWVTVATGLTRTIVGSGTVNGINYIDVRFSGTTTGVIDIQVKLDGNASAIAGSTGQSWASSSWVALVGGSTANITNQWLALNEYSAGPTYLRSSFPASNILSGGATLTRISGVTTLGASTTIVEPVIILRTGSSVAIDITLRIGLPQLELGAFATSVIPTTTTALTRSADVASVNTLSPWYNSTEYTLYHEGMVLTNDNGIVYSGVGDTFDNTAYLTRVAPNQIGAVLSSAAPVAQMNVNTTPSSGVPFKMAMKVKANDFAFCVNGGSVTTDTSGAVPVSTVRLGIGNAPWTPIGGNARQQWVRRITFYPRGLSSAELQAITA